MQNIYNDNNYLNIVGDILYNGEFRKIQNSVHHGLSRLDHSVRVSYYSYLVSKCFGLNYIQTARAGLMHDFFVTGNLTKKERAVSAFIHPWKALANSSKYFVLSDMEVNIIESHMFPLVPNKIPKYFESWIVSLVDKAVATYEFSYSYTQKVICRVPSAYMLTLLLLFRLGL